MNINEAHSVAIRQMCRDQRPRPNNRPTHMLPSLNAAEKRRHDRTITCRGGRKITRCSCPDCVPSKESPPAAPAGPPPPADSGRLLSIVKKRITLSDFGPRHSALLLAVYVFSLFNVPPPQTGRTEIKRRMMTTAEKKREENKRMDTREQNSERQTLVYPRRAKETDTIGQETPKSGAPATSRRYR